MNFFVMSNISNSVFCLEVSQHALKIIRFSSNFSIHHESLRSKSGKISSGHNKFLKVTKARRPDLHWFDRVDSSRIKRLLQWPKSVVKSTKYHTRWHTRRTSYDHDFQQLSSRCFFGSAVPDAPEVWLL